MRNDPSPDEPKKGILGWARGVLGINEYEDDYEYEEEDYRPETRRQPVTLRLQSSKLSHVAIRVPRSFDDARLAADGLKDGRQQIINLDKATPDMSERIIDFLSGVTYALNGFVEKVGERIYIFAPCNVVIDLPNDLRGSTSDLFDR